MKSILMSLLSMFVFTATLEVYASTNDFDSCVIGKDDYMGFVEYTKPVYFPISYISFGFIGNDFIGGNIDDAKATIYLDNEPVVTGSIYAFKSPFMVDPPSSVVRVNFKTPLVLPKGKTYRLVVPAGSYYKEKDPSDFNSELSIEFEVPEVLSFDTFSFPDESSVKETDRIGFGFCGGAQLIKNGEIILSRENIPIRKYPVNVWKSNGVIYAGIEFGEKIDFEKDVRYTLNISEGCVAATERFDIVNDANSLTLSFIGGGEIVSEPVEFSRNSMNEFRKNFEEKGVFGDIRFFYNRDVALTLNPSIRLEEDGKVIKEVVPTLSEENGEWVMTADFENTPADPDKKYSIVIPEATLVSGDAGVYVNNRRIVPIDGTTDVREIGEAGFAVKAENGVVTVDGVQDGTQVSIYALDGKQIYGAVAEGGTIRIPVTAPGVYVLKAGDETRKITVK